jgi:endonuclease/exonuclease/phosphatase family metal-dependent hydrolase
MPTASCSVLTLNIEGDRHLNQVTALLQQLQPEVACLQEVFKVHLPQLAEAMGGAEYHFVPMLLIDGKGGSRFPPLGEYGLAFFSRLPMGPVQVKYYAGDPAHLPIRQDGKPNQTNRLVLWTDVQVGNEWLRIATTHFTWSERGELTPLQAENFATLRSIYLSDIREGLFCGDFNAPRGGEIYHQLTQMFQDNIPPDITTTLDKDLHRAGDLQFVVDYLFTAGPYQITDVQLHAGVSDHLGVSGYLTKIN